MESLSSPTTCETSGYRNEASQRKHPKASAFPQSAIRIPVQPTDGVTEYRPKETDADFRPIDEREMNGMIVDARLKGIACWNNMVPTLVLSNKVESYNPFQDYLEKLPAWDGIDRVTPFLQRVSDDELWLKGGRYWMRAMTAQWMGVPREHANVLVPVLVSSQQGWGKSTFVDKFFRSHSVPTIWTI